MGTFVSFFVIAVIVGFACFAVFHWVIKMDYSDTLSASIALAGSGFVVDYLMKYTNSRKKQRV